MKETRGVHKSVTSEKCANILVRSSKSPLQNGVSARRRKQRESRLLQTQQTVCGSRFRLGLGTSGTATCVSEQCRVEICIENPKLNAHCTQMLDDFVAG